MKTSPIFVGSQTISAPMLELQRGRFFLLYAVLHRPSAIRSARWNWRALAWRRSNACRLCDCCAIQSHGWLPKIRSPSARAIWPCSGGGRDKHGRSLGQGAAWQTAFETAIGLTTPLVVRADAPPGWDRELAVFRSSFAESLARVGRVADARVQWMQALALTDRQLVVDPRDPRLKEDRALLQSPRGQAPAIARRRPAALAPHGLSRQIRAAQSVWEMLNRVTQHSAGHRAHVLIKKAFQCRAIAVSNVTQHPPDGFVHEIVGVRQ